MKTVQNQTFWRDLLDQIPETVFVFKIDENENAKLIFANKQLDSLLGYRPEELVLQSETDQATMEALNGLVDRIASASRGELPPDEHYFSIADKWGKVRNYGFKFQLFKPKSSDFPHISVLIKPHQEGTQHATSSEAREEPTSEAFVDRVASPIMKSLLRQLPSIVKQHRHIVLTGEKGVGKHSLLKEMLQWPSFTERSIVYTVSEMNSTSQPVTLVIDTTDTWDAASVANLSPSLEQRDVRVVLLVEGSIDRFLSRYPAIQSWYYQLGAYVTLLPPLTVRKEDIALFIEQWKKGFEDFSGMKIRLTKEFESVLMTIEFKENFITLHSMLLNSLSTFKSGVVSQPLSPKESKVTPTGKVEIRPFNDMVRDYLREVLAHTNGKIYGQSGAAYLLKLKPTTLQSKLKKLDLR